MSWWLASSDPGLAPPCARARWATMEASEYVAWHIDVPLDSEECIADTPR